MLSVQSAAKISESAAPEGGRPSSVSPSMKLAVLLITRDDSLWPEIGGHLSHELILKQVDSIDELCTVTPAGQPAIVLWDSRDQTDAAAVLSTLQLHSTRFAVIVLDEAGASAWTNSLALRQIVAHVAVPIAAEQLKVALDSAAEEVKARLALLGSGVPALEDGTSPAASGPRKLPWIALAAVLLIALSAAFMLLGQRGTPLQPITALNPRPLPQQAGNSAAADDKTDLLIEQAQQAMLDRRFIEPAEGSALTLYRRALALHPDSGEARQGLQRLAEILFARAQSALDERKIDIALQALETARSINPADGRLAALDERIASLRAEFGPAQILAAINAQNFDRAAQLIDDAARAKSLNNAKLAQLRDDLHRRHQDFETANFVKLIDARLEQDELTEPHNDSAGYYLAEARAHGANAAALQPQSQEFYKRVGQALHAAIEQRHLTEADRLLADVRSYGAPAGVMSGLQRELTAARIQQSAPAPEEPQSLDLAQSRLAQGKVTEPDDDSALYYVNQLRTADPKNSGLARISSAVQAKILDQSRSALDTAQLSRAEALLQAASGLGTSSQLAELNQRLAQMKQAAAGPPEVVEASLTRVKGIQIDYPEGALRKNVEGWVDLSYVVTAEGKVTSAKVLASYPAGVFDSAATRSLSRVRYKPVVQDGQANAVSTKLRITFRLTK
jgi:TonB family protein